MSKVIIIAIVVLDFSSTWYNCLSDVEVELWWLTKVAFWPLLPADSHIQVILSLWRGLVNTLCWEEQSSRVIRSFNFHGLISGNSLGCSHWVKELLWLNGRNYLRLLYRGRKLLFIVRWSLLICWLLLSCWERRCIGLNLNNLALLHFNWGLRLLLGLSGRFLLLQLCCLASWTIVSYRLDWRDFQSSKHWSCRWW